MHFDFPKIQDETARAAIEAAIGDFVRSFYAKGAAPIRCSVPSSQTPSPISTATFRSSRISGRARCYKPSATKASRSRPMSTCPSSPLISNVGSNCSSTPREKRCRQRRPNKRSPRRATWLNVSSRACFPSLGWMERPRRFRRMNRRIAAAATPSNSRAIKLSGPQRPGESWPQPEPRAKNARFSAEPEFS